MHGVQVGLPIASASQSIVVRVLCCMSCVEGSQLVNYDLQKLNFRLKTHRLGNNFWQGCCQLSFQSDHLLNSQFSCPSCKDQGFLQERFLLPFCLLLMYLKPPPFVPEGAGPLIHYGDRDLVEASDPPDQFVQNPHHPKDDGFHTHTIQRMTVSGPTLSKGRRFQNPHYPKDDGFDETLPPPHISWTVSDIFRLSHTWS